jgi:hypothetical protein
MLVGLLVFLVFLQVRNFRMRRFERVADREAVALTGDPEAYVTALVKLTRLNLLPLSWGKWEGRLLTHPSGSHRVQAVARLGGIAPERLEQLLAAPENDPERYAVPPGAAHERVLSSAYKRDRALRLAWALMAVETLAPALVAAVLQWGEWEGPVWWAVALGGLALTLAGFVVAAGAFVAIELRAAEPIIPMTLFGNRTFVVATALGAAVGLGMFSAIAFMPTFLQMSSGLSAAGSGLLMTPMVAGIIVTIQSSAAFIQRTGRYKALTSAGVLVILVAMVWMTTLSGGTSLWTVGAMFFLLGAGLGLIMQNVVLAAQNAVPASQIGTATSTNNYFREVGATLGVAVFGTLFTSRLADSLGSALAGHAEQAVQAGITSPDTLVPAAVEAAGEPLRAAIVDAYAGALAPVFWYLVPILGVAFLLSLVLKEVPLSDVAGMVARGEAVESEEELRALQEDEGRETPARRRRRRASAAPVAPEPRGLGAQWPGTDAVPGHWRPRSGFRGAGTP